MRISRVVGKQISHTGVLLFNFLIFSLIVGEGDRLSYSCNLVRCIVSNITFSRRNDVKQKGEEKKDFVYDILDKDTKLICSNIQKRSNDLLFVKGISKAQL